MDYKEEYEKEHNRNAALAVRITELEAANEELQFKLDRIKNNPLWKISKPLRSVMHWGIRQWRRLRGLGGPRGVAAKIRYKKRLKAAMRKYGTESFPTPEEAEEQRKTVFGRPVKISILVPLYNTPPDFLKQIDRKSVV